MAYSYRQFAPTATLPFVVPSVEPTRVLDGFRARYLAQAPFREDRARVDELVLECSPAVDALLFAVRSGPGADLSAPEYREGLAFLSLLGRRSAALGVTPLAALSVVPALLGALVECGVGVDPFSGCRETRLPKCVPRLWSGRT